jgi:transcriptional regulator with XRE-family HTH domain
MYTTLSNEAFTYPQPKTAPAVRPVVRRSMNRVGSTSYGAEGLRSATVGQRLVKRRFELNLTQAEVAGRVKYQPKSGAHENVERPLSRNAYCMWERDRQEPSLELLRRLASVLDVSPAWLAFGVWEKRDDNPETAYLTACHGHIRDPGAK